MDVYLWIFTLLHVVLIVRFALFHVVSFDQSLTAFRSLCQLTHQFGAHSCRRSPSQDASRRRSPSLRVPDTLRLSLDTSTRLHLVMPGRGIAHTLGTLLFILRTYVLSSSVEDQLFIM